jgi:hypothetical protein
MSSWWQYVLPVRDFEGERPLLALRVDFGPREQALLILKQVQETEGQALKDRVCILSKAQKEEPSLKGGGKDFPSSFSTHPRL